MYGVKWENLARVLIWRYGVAVMRYMSILLGKTGLCCLPYTCGDSSLSKQKVNKANDTVKRVLDNAGQNVNSHYMGNTMIILNRRASADRHIHSREYSH